MTLTNKYIDLHILLVLRRLGQNLTESFRVMLIALPAMRRKTRDANRQNPSTFRVRFTEALESDKMQRQDAIGELTCAKTWGNAKSLFELESFAGCV